jgi:predicted acyltransferase
VRAGITVLILVGYWLAMAFVPVPDAGGAGPFTLEGNLVGYIDHLFLHHGTQSLT